MAPALYLDCDGFFASCEESADPALHGRPVAVSTTDPESPGAVLIAVNPEAQRQGVGKGERAHEARAAVADLAIRPQRAELYVATHHAIAHAVDSVLPGPQPRSIDELWADLAPEDDPERIFTQVKGAIRAAVGPVITVSCAIGPSAFLARTAAEAHKGDDAGDEAHGERKLENAPAALGCRIMLDEQRWGRTRPNARRGTRASPKRARTRSGTARIAWKRERAASPADLYGTGRMRRSRRGREGET